MATTHRAAFAGSRPWSEAEFAGLLRNPACFGTGTSKCFALVRLVADEAELLTIATHPSFRRQGLALAVMTKWATLARNRGAARAFLEVAADNAAAITLYRACSFESEGVRRGYYRRATGGPVDALIMSRPLT